MSPCQRNTSVRVVFVPLTLHGDLSPCTALAGFGGGQPPSEGGVWSPHSLEDVCKQGEGTEVDGCTGRRGGWGRRTASAGRVPSPAFSLQPAPGAEWYSSDLMRATGARKSGRTLRDSAGSVVRSSDPAY